MKNKELCLRTTSPSGRHNKSPQCSNVELWDKGRHNKSPQCSNVELWDKGRHNKKPQCSATELWDTSQSIPTLKVGIQYENNIKFSLVGNYVLPNNEIISGTWQADIVDNKINLSSENKKLLVDSGVTILPRDNANIFTLFDVTIGVNFHWQRDENQSFNGGLELIVEDNKIHAVNIINIEDYLTSVISSEMSATSSLELLKAHAVISRSWILAQINKSENIVASNENYNSCTENYEERIKWYDREDHNLFDVCADDHCQRYQGVSRKTSEAVEQAVSETRGVVLMYDGKICDARFSKCCGGVSEAFENVWEPVKHPYLSKIIDNEQVPDAFDTDLEDEQNAQKWILGTPDAFCNTNDKSILQQVLNDYDQETNDYYRWRVEYEQVELSQLVKQRTGIDFGIIQSFEVLERGVSGRIIRLKIVGSKRTFTIGKELEIRKALSESHLYSSAFVINKVEDAHSKVKFVLIGSGWGHGVGLCQIGAAVMGQKGFSYDDILKHYFRGAKLQKQY